MIELNLLPDVKLEYIRAERQRRLVLSVSFLVAAVAVGLLVLTMSVSALQKKHLKDLNQDITSRISQLQSQPQIGRILTVQNQLNSLNTLHDKKPAAARLFDYLDQVTPAQVDISSLEVDFAAGTLTFTGSADSLASVNKYIDTLKFTNYKDKSSPDQTAPAFSNVVMSSFGLTANSQNGHPASYNITLGFNPDIFNITKDIQLVVPNQVTTRSQVDRPADLFQSSSSSTDTGGR